MDQREFQHTVLLLSGERPVAIRRVTRDGEWHMASGVARSLDIHVTTASKFLQGLAEVGLLERRAHDGRTFEDRLRSPRLELSVDLLEESGPLRPAVEFYVTYS